MEPKAIAPIIGVILIIVSLVIFTSIYGRHRELTVVDRTVDTQDTDVGSAVEDLGKEIAALKHEIDGLKSKLSFTSSVPAQVPQIPKVENTVTMPDSVQVTLSADTLKRLVDGLTEALRPILEAQNVSLRPIPIPEETYREKEKQRTIVRPAQPRTIYIPAPTAGWQTCPSGGCPTPTR